MLILLISLIIIIIVLLNTLNTPNEHFNNIKQQIQQTQRKCTCLHKSQIKNPKFNIKAYTSNNWHLRFPYMVNPRYSYDDTPNGISTTIYDYAILKELPIDVNKFYKCTL